MDLPRPQTSFRIRSVEPARPAPGNSRTAELFQDEITPENLRKWTGKPDLTEVEELDLVVDDREQGISRIGELLPSLTRLKLNDSYLSSFRDLGTALKGLRVIWLSRCGLRDLDGIGVLPALRELYLSFNMISNITPLALHETLEVLDLEANSVASLDQLDQLGTCQKLASVTLESNPVALCPGYRDLMKHYVPSLELLDDEPVDGSSAVSDDTIAAAAAFLKERSWEQPDTSNEAFMVADAVRMAEGDDDGVGGGGGGGASARPSSPGPNLFMRINRPASAGSPTAAMYRPGSARPRTAVSGRGLTLDEQWKRFESAQESSHRPSSSHGSRVMNALLSRGKRQNTSSSLTHGTGDVMAGGLAAALRRRRRGTTPDAGPGISITDTLDKAAKIRSMTRGQLTEELRLWTESYSHNPALPRSVRKPPRTPSTSRPATAAGSFFASSTSKAPTPNPALSASVRIQRTWSDDSDRPSTGSNASVDETASPSPATPSVLGEAVFTDDDTLIQMLRKKPKSVPVLKSRHSFRRFFAGMPISRMTSLLEEAYNECDASTRATRVQKRLELLANCLDTSG